MFPRVTRVIASPVRAGRPHEDGRATWVLNPHLSTHERRAGAAGERDHYLAGRVAAFVPDRVRAALPGRRAAGAAERDGDHRVRCGHRRVGRPADLPDRGRAPPLGAFAGDNLSYLIGWRFASMGDAAVLLRREGRRPAGTGPSGHCARFGTGLIIVCRFIPGGRTAVTLCCGLVRYPWRRFAVATAIAAVVWASLRVPRRADRRQGVRGQAAGRIRGGLRRGAGFERDRRSHQAAHRVAEEAEQVTPTDTSNRIPPSGTT